jgi:predicted HAD superfamily phosphohydrolase YqeG
MYTAVSLRIELLNTSDIERIIRDTIDETLVYWDGYYIEHHIIEDIVKLVLDKHL